jgi:hypothetical protein
MLEFTKLNLMKKANRKKSPVLPLDLDGIINRVCPPELHRACASAIRRAMTQLQIHRSDTSAPMFSMVATDELPGKVATGIEGMVDDVCPDCAGDPDLSAMLNMTLIFVLCEVLRCGGRQDMTPAVVAAALEAGANRLRDRFGSEDELNVLMRTSVAMFTQQARPLS